jgi:hypothetical protein
MKSSRFFFAVASLLVLITAAPATSWGATPVRDGFTVELGLGAAFSHVGFNDQTSLNEFGNSMLTLSVGMFVHEDVAIMAHLAGAASYPSLADGDDVLLTNQFAGVVGQYWITDRLYVSGGLGAALWAVAFDDDADTIARDYGLALSGRAGYSFATWQQHSLRVAVEVIPEFFDSRNVIATALNLEWQCF